MMCILEIWVEHHYEHINRLANASSRMLPLPRLDHLANCLIMIGFAHGVALRQHNFRSQKPEHILEAKMQYLPLCYTLLASSLMTCMYDSSSARQEFTILKHIHGFVFFIVRIWSF